MYLGFFKEYNKEFGLLDRHKLVGKGMSNFIYKILMPLRSIVKLMKERIRLIEVK